MPILIKKTALRGLLGSPGASSAVRESGAHDDSLIRSAAGEQAHARILERLARQLSAAPDTSLTYLCIQTRQNSLEAFTAEDAIVY